MKSISFGKWLSTGLIAAATALGMSAGAAADDDCCAQCAATFLEDTLEPSLSLRKCQCGGVFCNVCAAVAPEALCKMLSGGRCPLGREARVAAHACAHSCGRSRSVGARRTARGLWGADGGL